MSDLWEAFGPASERIVDAFFEGREPEAQDLAAVRAVLDYDLWRLGFRADQREDLVAEALCRVLRAVRHGRVDRAANIAGFVRVVGRHTALDAGRYLARRPTESLDREFREASSDDQLAGLLDAMSSSGEVYAALALAVEDGELELAGLISQWLILAEVRGEAPSTREAAEALETNHMRIQRSLDQFGHYLARVRSTDA